ncbi:MAG: hypothetical protein JWN74_848 [Acidobacteriaceae bacterium]|nr:hypothetical protein [Acidobacteriaceae bacterium]
MSEPSLVISLKDFGSKLKALKKDVKAETVQQIAKMSLRSRAESLGTEWFSSIEPTLKSSNFDPSLLLTYSENFQKLIKLSGPSNLRTRYLTVLNDVSNEFRSDFVLAAQTKPATPTSQLATLLAGITNTTQSEYLKEAIECSKYKLYRAAAMLGWSATIDQIHRAIEKIGFAKFNIASSAMASQTKGRFKKFNQVQNVSSLSDLREVFDNIILWILEGMQLIDSNQHTRLHSCFELRCQCSHPGEAPITEYNLLSFFSDINEIVFKNPKLTP